MARRRDYTNIRPGSEPVRNVKNIYEDSDTRGYPRTAEPPRRRDPADNSAEARQGRVDPAKSFRDPFNQNTPQHPENFHDKNYSNQTTGWVRGCKSGEPTGFNESGEHKPFFDKGHAYRSPSKGNVFGRETIRDHAVDHNRHHSEFTLKHNAGVTHDPMAHDFSKRHVAQYEKRGEHNNYTPKHTGPWMRDKQ
jgi:hypothetical protein